MTVTDTKPEVKDAQKRDRSPKFPYIGLKKAVERIEVLHSKVKRYDALVSVIAKDWDLSPKSSSTDRTVAAIQSFGLIEDSGSGDTRKIKLTELGARIISDLRPGVREALLAEAALKPPVIAHYAKLWEGGRPDDAHALSTLQFEGSFTEEGARMFLRVFDETIRFTSSGSADKGIEEKPDSETDKGRAKVGDIVNVEIDGVMQFAKPVRVHALKEHEGRQWVFVEGSDTGVLMEQIRVIESGTPIVDSAQASAPPKLSLEGTAGPQQMKQGEREWLRGPLSKETSYRLIVSGDLGPKEIGKLIKMLTAQKSILSDDEPEEGDED